MEKKREVVERAQKTQMDISLLGLELKKQAKQGKPIVGFYRDKDGKTKPITKSVAQLKRKKVVEGSHGFRGVAPEERVGISERLERTMEDLTCVSNNLDLLRGERVELLAHGSSTDSVDRQIAAAERHLAMLKNALRHLGGSGRT